MTVKKIFAALLVPALSATLLAGTASAKYECDASGARTWTFDSSDYLWLDDNTYYLYDDSLNTASDQTLYEDQLLIYGVTYTYESFGTVNYVESYIYSPYYHCPTGSSISFKAPFDGTVSVSADYASNLIRINETPGTTATVKGGDTVKITAAKNSLYYFSDITGITFTPTKENKTFTVDPITIGSDTTDAGVTFKADGYNNWDCSIWNYVKDFKGTVNFNVKMNNVPNTVSVSAESYVK